MMKVLILGSKNYSNKRIAKELKNSGHNVAIVDPLKFTLKISDKSGHDVCYYQDKRIFANSISGIIPRIGKHFNFGCAVVKHLNKNMGIYSPSTSNGLKNASDKYLCTQLLSQNKLQVPRTMYFQKPDNYAFLVDHLGGYPIVAKLLTGSQGAGVFILNDDVAGSTALSTIAKSHKILLQEYIETAKEDENKCDIRAWVVGDKVVASMKRFAVDKDFRSNYSISKNAEAITLTKEQELFAILCARAVGLDYAGVDLMVNVETNKTYCIEVNGNASLSGIEKVTQINVAAEIANHMSLKVQKNDNSTMNTVPLNIDFDDYNDITRDFLEEDTDEDFTSEMSCSLSSDKQRLSELKNSGVTAWIDRIYKANNKEEVKLYHQTKLSKQRRDLIHNQK